MAHLPLHVVRDQRVDLRDVDGAVSGVEESLLVPRHPRHVLDRVAVPAAACGSGGGSGGGGGWSVEYEEGRWVRRERESESERER